MIRRRTTFLLAAGLLGAGGCNDSGQPMGEAGAAMEAPPPMQEYRLAAGDKVRIVVFNEDQLTGEYTVDPNGSISLPLAGAIPAAGKTGPELQGEVRRRLSGPFLRDPNVSVQVTQTRPFYVLGEVTRSGEYAFRPGLSLPAAIAIAGGFTFRGNQRRVLITRYGSGQEVPVAVSPSVQVGPGDLIRVPERYL